MLDFGDHTKVIFLELLIHFIFIGEEFFETGTDDRFLFSKPVLSHTPRRYSVICSGINYG